MSEDGLKKPALMGILNVTPDSFSNEGEHFQTDAAITHARLMVEQGADILDIGGESTRPGADRVPASEQINRVVPVIEALMPVIGDKVPISIDTTSALVAKEALAAGASIINDVSAGREDESMFAFTAQVEVPYIMMHMQGQPKNMQDAPCYENVLEEVLAFLMSQASAAEAAGVKSSNILIDPGIGFGKSKQNNLDLVANLHKFSETGYGVLLGASRKRFMGSICDIEKYSELVGATCATTALAVMAGVDMIRVHDIRENRQALDVAYALKQSIAK